MLKKKTLSFFLFGTVTLILGVVSVGLYMIDWNQYRDTLADLASQRLGMQVELAGDLNLGLLPRPTVTAQAVRLSPLQNDFNDTIATADRIDMHLGLTALMRGSMELQSLDFEGLSAGLVETPEGWTIKGWPITPDSPESTADTTLLSLDRFRIKSGSISVQPLNSKAVVFDGVDLALSGRLPGGPLDLLGTAFVEGSAISLTGKVVPTRTIGSTSVRFDVEAADSRLEFSGRLSDDGIITGRFQAAGNNLLAFATFVKKTMGVDGSLSQIPPLPYGIDLQIERSTGDITRLISRQFEIGNTRGNIDLTVAEQGGIYHVAGASSFGIIAMENWLGSEPADSGADAGQSTFPIAGNIDIAIEGVEFKGGLVQQVQALISFPDGQVSLDQFSATLPGASRLLYVAEAPNIGAIKFQSGGIQEIFKWLGLTLSDAIPAGRLSTADIAGKLTIVDEAWVLSNLSGTLDTTGVLAEMSGKKGSFVPNAVKVKIDQLNLDAYWPEPQFENYADGGQALDMQFDLEVGQLRWLQQTFDDVSLSGQFARDLTSVSNFSASHLGGSLKGNFSKQDLSGQSADVETTLTFIDWQPAALAGLSPDIASFLLRFSRGGSINGKVVATGPLTELQTQISVASGDNTLEFAGSVDATENRRIQLQGSIKHTNIDRLLEMEDITGTAETVGSASADLRATLEGTADAFAFSANGVVLGGQSNFSGTYVKGHIAADVSLTIQPDVQNGFGGLVRQYGFKLDPTKLSRLRLKWANDDKGWRIADLDARNGDAVVVGNLNSAGGALNGAVSISNLDLGTLFSGSNRSGSTFLPDGGKLDVRVSNITWLGQLFNAPTAVVTFTPTSGVFEAGRSAALNGNPLQAKVEYDKPAENVSAVVSAASLDIGKLVHEVAGARGFSGQISTSVNLQGSLSEDGSFIKTITGDGRFEGGAGAMHFIAVKELITAVSNSISSVNFLQSVGNLLRVGDTDFADLSGSFRLDNGVALVDEIVASGDWGQLALGGQVNLPGDYVNMKGQLSLSQPLDAPAIPVVYEGRLSAPDVRWTSRALEQFAIAGVERRLRSRIFGELEQAGSGQPDSAQSNPGAAVFGVANSLLEKLRARQKEAKRVEAEKKANENVPTDGSSSPGFEGQMLL